jgi:hypothetical protein
VHHSTYVQQRGIRPLAANLEHYNNYYVMYGFSKTPFQLLLRSEICSDRRRRKTISLIGTRRITRLRVWHMTIITLRYETFSFHAIVHRNTGSREGKQVGTPCSGRVWTRNVSIVLDGVRFWFISKLKKPIIWKPNQIQLFNLIISFHTFKFVRG